MRLKTVAIKGFRGARKRLELNIDPEFTILSGRNDAGKSTFLDALDIFFKSSKLDLDDFNMSGGVPAENAYIEVTFDNLPDDVVLDSKYRTTFASEFLTNGNGDLTIRHSFTRGKITKALLADHPLTKDDERSLLSFNNKQLKDFAALKEVDLSECNKSINAQLRQTIYRNTDLFSMAKRVELDVNSGDLKTFFPKLEKNYPVFHLFSAENVSNEGEKYVQDPVKAIVRQVIENHESDLEKVALQINRELETALLAVSHELGQLAPTLKTKFSPHNIEAKWENAYKSVAFHDENNVPLATRGSGMRRLALLSFFRVSAQGLSKGRPVVFAVEEPEVFLHPDLQQEVWDALTDLSLQAGSQVVITSHSSNLISKTSVTQVRYLSDGLVEQVESVEDVPAANAFVNRIEQSLGKFRDSNVELFLLVEGKNDITAIEKLANNPTSTELRIFGEHLNKGRILVLPIGGTGSVGLWNRGRLDDFSKPVVFLRDRDNHPPTEDTREDLLTKIMKRDFIEVYHSRREMENLLSPSLIVSQMKQDWQVDELKFRQGLDVYGLNESNMIDCDVPVSCAKAYYFAQVDGELTTPDEEKIKSKESNAKKILAKAFGSLDEASTQNLMSSNFGELISAINNSLKEATN